MSKIEREMIAEARAARHRQEEAMRRCASDCAVPCSACLMPPDAVWVSAADIGADIPSAPDDEQADETPWWQYAHVLGHVPPLCREDEAAKARSAVEMLECHGWRWEHGAWQVPNA